MPLLAPSAGTQQRFLLQFRSDQLLSMGIRTGKNFHAIRYDQRRSDSAPRWLARSINDSWMQHGEGGGEGATSTPELNQNGHHGHGVTARPVMPAVKLRFRESFLIRDYRRQAQIFTHLLVIFIVDKDHHQTYEGLEHVIYLFIKHFALFRFSYLRVLQPSAATLIVSF